MFHHSIYEVAFIGVGFLVQSTMLSTNTSQLLVCTSHTRAFGPVVMRIMVRILAHLHLKDFYGLTCSAFWASGHSFGWPNCPLYLSYLKETNKLRWLKFLDSFEGATSTFGFTNVTGCFLWDCKNMGRGIGGVYQEMLL